jgi:hypothetical protein
MTKRTTRPLGNEPNTRRIKPTEADLDTLQTPTWTADWMQLKRRTLINAARRGLVPCVRVNERVLRFHPRTILATLSGK